MKKHLLKKNLLKAGKNGEGLWHLKYKLLPLSTFPVQHNRNSPQVSAAKTQGPLYPRLPVKVVVSPREEQAVSISHLLPLYCTPSPATRLPTTLQLNSRNVQLRSQELPCLDQFPLTRKRIYLGSSMPTTLGS